MNGWHFYLTAGSMLVIVCSVAPSLALAEEAALPGQVDPADWGTDHVGKPMPEYITGDECLFCHREIGPAWPANRHQLTVQMATPDALAIEALRQRADGKDFADQTQFLMGSRRVTRFLKRSKDYGKLELLAASLVPASSSARDGSQTDQPRKQYSKEPTKAREWKSFHTPRWDKTTFGDRCAGCHATGVDTAARAFSAISLDCYTCHGEVPLEHTKDVRHVLLSSKNQEPRQTVSICGQCHLRGGTSKSSGLPYPNTFVAGDNLFRDFAVDFRDETIQAMSPVDRHVYQNARDVTVLGRANVTCLTCHNVHGQSSEKHQDLGNTTICSTCHVPNSENTELLEIFLRSMGPQAHSRVCDY